MQKIPRSPPVRHALIHQHSPAQPPGPPGRTILNKPSGPGPTAGAALDLAAAPWPDPWPPDISGSSFSKSRVKAVKEVKTVSPFLFIFSIFVLFFK